MRAAHVHDQRGMSLVETTVILFVLATLTAVLAPTIGSYVNDARDVQAREDVEALGATLVQMLKDTGAPFPLIDPGALIADRYKVANRVELLVSAGNTPGVTGVDVGTDANGPVAPRNWDDAIAPGVESIEDHMMTNVAAYPSAVPTPANGTTGWRGAYVTKLGNGDPWGYRYAVSTLYLGWATNAPALSAGWNEDAMVISPGANGIVETVFNHAAGDVSGDDVGLVVSAATR